MMTEETVKGRSVATKTQVMAMAVPRSGERKVRMIGFDAEAEIERAERVARERRRYKQRKSAKIDGFILLEASGVEFPEEAYMADVSRLDAGEVVEEDFEYFPRLAVVDASENELKSILPFTKLERLKHLKFNANGLEQVSKYCSLERRFERLLRLDLGYNALRTQAIEELGHWAPALRELDLSGNQLTAVPASLDHFQALERLILEYNQLSASERVKPNVHDQDHPLRALATIPRLRELQLGHNKLSQAAPNWDTEEAASIFTHLQILGLGHNSISNIEAVQMLAALPKLEFLSLYGNPLVLDTTANAADTLTAATLRLRDGWTERRIDINDKVPGTHRKGQQLRHLTVARISKTRTKIPTAAEFRHKGNAQLNLVSTPSTHSEIFNKTQLNVLDSPSQHHNGSQEIDAQFSENLDQEPSINSSLALARVIEPHRKSNSAKMRNALTALRYALNHPVTAHLSEVPTQRGGLVPLAIKPTKASLAKRRPPTLQKHIVDDDAIKPLSNDDNDDRKELTFLGQDQIEERRRDKAHLTETLDELGEVLDGINNDFARSEAMIIPKNYGIDPTPNAALRDIFPL